MSEDEQQQGRPKRRSRIAPPGSAANASSEGGRERTPSGGGSSRPAPRPIAPRNRHYRGSTTSSVSPSAAPPASRAEPARPASPGASPDRADGPSRETRPPTIRDPEVVVLCTRNDGDVVAERIRAWRAALPSLRSRVVVLDLGSTDPTVALARAERVDVHSVEGGRVAPLATLDEAVGVFDEPIVIFADASVDPPAAIRVHLDAVHDGAAARVHQRPDGAVFVCRRAAWRGQPFAGHSGLLDWAARAADDPIVGRCTPVADDAFEVGIVRAALVPPLTLSPVERLQPVWRSLRELAGATLLGRLG